MLVVDDVPDVTEMIALFLKHAGYDVATADSATTALQLATETTFNLIISDIGMPEMNGYEATEYIRRELPSGKNNIPIIAMTGHAMNGEKEKCLEAGASDYLAKPVNTEQLLSALRMWLHR